MATNESVSTDCPSFTGNDAAFEEGWGIFEANSDPDTIVNGHRYGDRPFELQRDDETGVFATDEDAWRHVFTKAAHESSMLHIDALAFLAVHSPAEHAAIIAFAVEHNL